MKLCVTLSLIAISNELYLHILCGPISMYACVSLWMASTNESTQNSNLEEHRHHHPHFHENLVCHMFVCLKFQV